MNKLLLFYQSDIDRTDQAIFQGFVFLILLQREKSKQEEREATFKRRI